MTSRLSDCAVLVVAQASRHVTTNAVRIEPSGKVPPSVNRSFGVAPGPSSPTVIGIFVNLKSKYPVAAESTVFVAVRNELSGLGGAAVMPK